MPANVVLGTLKHVWNVLKTFDLPMAVTGGIALASWQHFRATRDIDLLISLGRTDLNDLLRTLLKAGIKPKRPPITLDSLRILQLQYEPPGAFVDVQVDLLLGDSAYHVHALQRRVTTCLPDIDLEFFVLSCEDLVIHKLLARRIIDRADAAALLRLNRAALDVPYLLKWSERLNLMAELAVAWQEAFPGETLPRE